MPIYEFQCQSCGHEIEIIQKISDDPITDCAECGKPDMKKKVSAAAFRLSGTGWYETDFKSGKKKNLTDDSSKSKKESKPKPDTKKTTARSK